MIIDMSKKRIIKKYPNRRLYDTEESRYITLEDIKKLVLDNKEFIVRDVKTDQDLTRMILLQIIIEQEDYGEPLFSTEALSHIIRFYGNAFQSAASDYLQKSIDLFVDQQKQFQENFQSMVNDPIDTMTRLTEQNMAIWKNIQESFLDSAMQTHSNDKGKKDKKTQRD